MKVLYLGVYRDNTGWGEAATRYILALDAAGVDVVCRPVKLNDTVYTPHERVLELEHRPARGCDVVIQHVLPHQMDYCGRFALNVGVYFSETDSIRHSSWNDRLNQMDLVIGCNKQMEEAAVRNSHVSVPYRVVPIPCDVSAYNTKYEPLERLKYLKDEGYFVFYTVGEYVRRKNVAALLKAFHTEFSPEEPVQLVIKTSRPGLPPHEMVKHVAADCMNIKKWLKLYGRGEPDHYKREVIISDRLSDTDMFRLHAACDCFVQPSHGEAWSIPAFDAMALGNTPIVTDWSGYPDYIRINDTEVAGWLVPCRQEQVFGVDDGFADLYTGKESWAAVDHLALRHAMREAYQDQGLRNRKAAAGAKRATDFSFEKVGATLREVLKTHVEYQRKWAGSGDALACTPGECRGRNTSGKASA